MQSYTIHLIRHGATKGNQLGQYIGRTDLPLAPEGAEQLRELSRAGGYPTAQVYYCSPLLRCRETLNILYPDAEPVVVEGLRECDFGEWEGKTAKELMEEDPSFAKWMESGAQATPPGGESGAVFMHRVCEAFEKLVEDMLRSRTTSAVIVTHGGVIMTILSAYGLPKAGFYDWLTGNGCGYSLRITPGLWMRSMVAEVYATLPAGEQTQDEQNERLVIDLAREAADRAYGKKEDTEKGE